MNHTTISTWRSQTAEIFENLRFRAVLGSLPAKIFGKQIKLKSFEEQAFRVNTLRISRGEPIYRDALRNYLGEQDIPVDRISGSVGRENDFDSHFRPLKKHLRDRWIKVYALTETGECPPIHLYKIGSDYFVADGHHRVSVARTLGRLSLRAKVWEIPFQPEETSCAICLPESKNRKREMARA